MSGVVHYNKCPVCAYEYEEYWDSHTPYKVQVNKGDEPFINLNGMQEDKGTWVQSIDLIACPKCKTVRIK
jgi:DNA-directed RNA polymerase subunit M/transcription elongation factor TFIIS